jgi:hypothetical protein
MPAPTTALQSLHPQVEWTLENLKERLANAEDDNSKEHHSPIPH